MFDLNKLRAIGAMVARQAQEKAAADPEAANNIIDMSPLLKEWKPGTMDKPITHTLGEVCTYTELPWHCIIPHTHSGETGWEPGGDAAMWALYHGRDAAHALPFRKEGHNPYNKGHWMIWTDGYRYRSNMDTNTWTPEEYAKGWDGPFDDEGGEVK